MQNSCTICIALFGNAFLIIIGISSAFIYFNWHLKRRNVNAGTNINPGTETVTY